MTFTIMCPYCRFEHAVQHPGGYLPIYADCPNCGNRFVVEPERHGVTTYTLEDAPCCSDPECREIEMGASDND
jgi:DNA-directed RNA polymerase subunit RPC12/RpoP